MASTASTHGVFQPYSAHPHGQWTRAEATHLLWRTQFGATHAEIETAVADGLEATLERLLTPQPESAAFDDEAGLMRQVAFDSGNIADLKAWWLYRMLRSANPLVEKMSLFWHNHFATSYRKIRSVLHMAAQNDLIRSQALGSFGELLHGMTRDVAMLIWLDGNANRKRHANENFAREVMELFSLGVGNYTEEDIQQAARAFTGWHVRNEEFWFNRIQHDFGSKQVLGKQAKFDGDDIIDLCLEQDACPRFLSTKLLRSFLHAHPDTETIDALAERIRIHEFDLQATLRDLLGSELFFQPQFRQTLIKSPLEFVLGTIRTLEGRPNLVGCVKALAELGQDVFEPPTVKGWEGGRLWVNSATLLQRANVITELTLGTSLGNLSAPEQFVEANAWHTPEDVVDGYARLLLGHSLDADTQQDLLTLLQQSPGSLEDRLRELLQVMCTMPEYQLC